MIGYVYKIINDINDKVYVGQTWKTPEQRFDRHCSDSKYKNNNTRPILRAIKKYGPEHFQIIVLEQIENCTQKILDAKEIYWSIELNSLSPNGYNLKIGEANGKLSEETKLKISKGNKGKPASNKGKKATLYTKEKMKASHIQYEYTLQSPFGDIFITNNLKEFAKEHKLNVYMLYNILADRRKHHKNWVILTKIKLNPEKERLSRKIYE